MVSRQDVADRAGVSAAVVSYVLNNRNIVKEATRQKVLKAVLELNYKPNLLARSLKTKKSKQIVVLVQFLGNPFEAGILLRIESVAKENGYFVFFQTYEETQEVQLQELYMGRVDGILLLGQSLKESTIEHFNAMGIPIVSIMEPVRRLQLDGVVDIDWIGAMRQLVRHLKEYGHERIAFMSGGSDNHHYECRFRAFLEALTCEGMLFHSGDKLENPGRFESAHAQMKQRLEQTGGRLPFQALICANDLMAAGSLAACRELGIEVPGTLSIAGCEDILMSSQTHPPLTVIHFPRPEAAELAAYQLLARMEGTEPPFETERMLKGTLVIRDSTGRRLHNTVVE
ncbi:LacI family DNA-binding transcriptional regulator [Paenibacillus periandrae]|uniref:LacI family DNA-binding transcriptional regulator n=1 Tax=Paenibacillus periandrae TaxID=1761741 RepID=UPI001F092278|nr:LacI family DNA-binding transcriptional regulator [Paenibacillus periandrae]